MNTATPVTDPAVEPLLKIERLIASGLLKEAAKALNGARDAFPQDPRVQLLASRLAEASGNSKGAIEAAERAVQLAPQWKVAVAEFAYLLARLNHLPQAMSWAQRAVELGADDPELMGRMIEVAHRAQQFPQAILWLQQAVKLSPQDVTLQRLIARDLAIIGKLDVAHTIYSALVDADANDAEALTGRLRIALLRGERDAALRDADALVALQPDSAEARFWQTLARGETPSTLPAEMVRAQFDPLATLYDLHMVRALKYQLPREMAAMVTALYPERRLNLLDLGCGTGLLGLYLGAIDGALIGVDLSSPMVQQAMRHNVYMRFHTVNLLDALRETPPEQYHVITACDVFPYVGALDQAIPDALRVLRPGGHLLFSIEATRDDEPAMVLRPGMVFAHSAAAVEALCRSAGFASVTVTPAVLREEQGQPVHGLVFDAHKAS